jgi:salicylate hydroxylase
LSEPVLVVGGGIGGLAAALSLARHGIASRVLERQPEFTAAGAGIQLGPNGMHVLRRLGAAEHLEPHAGKPDGIDVYDGISGERLTRLPLGQWIAERYGAPYRTAHRGDLQAALLEVATRSPLIEIVNGFVVERVAETKAGTEAVADDGRRTEGACVIAADGLWSRVRRSTFAAPALPKPYRTASRTVISAGAVSPQFSGPSVGIWLAPNAHIVHYPVRGGSQIAVIVVLKDDWQGTDWATPAVRAEIDTAVARLAPELGRFLAHASEWRKWSLFDVPPLPAWVKGRVALIGDAAHPPLPFLAQGGVMALEDAYTIAECLAAAKGDPKAAFPRYEAQRKPRGTAVLAASRKNGRIYHMSGLPAGLRNAALKLAPPARLMARYDWLYGWKPA